MYKRQTWEYIPGRKNIAADVLSRINVTDQTFEGEKEKIFKVFCIIKNRKDLEDILNEVVVQQKQDPKLINIRNRLLEDEEVVNKYYCIHQDILFVKTKKHNSTWKLVVPKTLENKIIKDYHVRYGHMGTVKIVKALEEEVFIKNIVRKVNQNIKTCVICQMVKTNNEKKEGTMIPITSTTKLEKIFLDICGPFPCSGGRHKYKLWLLFIRHKNVRE